MSDSQCKAESGSLISTPSQPGFAPAGWQPAIPPRAGTKTAWEKQPARGRAGRGEMSRGVRRRTDPHWDVPTCEGQLSKGRCEKRIQLADGWCEATCGICVPWVSQADAAEKTAAEKAAAERAAERAAAERAGRRRGRREKGGAAASAGGGAREELYQRGRRARLVQRRRRTGHTGDRRRIPLPKPP